MFSFESFMDLPIIWFCLITAAIFFYVISILSVVYSLRRQFASPKGKGRKS